MLGFIEVFLKVSSIVELVGECISVDIGLIDVFGLWDSFRHLFLSSLELAFHHDLVVGLFGHVLPDPVPTIFAPEFSVLRVDLGISGCFAQSQDSVGRDGGCRLEELAKNDEPDHESYPGHSHHSYWQ